MHAIGRPVIFYDELVAYSQLSIPMY